MLFFAAITGVTISVDVDYSHKKLSICFLWVSCGYEDNLCNKQVFPGQV